MDEYLKQIYEKSKSNSEIEGDRLSAYFLPDLAKTLLRLCKDFPLWTNIMRKKFNSPYNIASSAVVENDFKELKTQILKFEIHPMTVDKFIITHLNNIESNAKLLKNSLERASQVSKDNFSAENTDKKNSNSTVSPTTSDDNDSITSLNAIENWRGQGRNTNMILRIPKTPRKKKPTKYMCSLPEIDKVLGSKHLRSNLNTILLNGNTATPVRLGKERYIVYNTCAFDSVAVIISMAYIDILNYKHFIDGSNNEFLNFSMQLALENSSRKIYDTRVLLLQQIFHKEPSVTNVKLINSRCNVSFIIINLLKTAPSAIENIECSRTECKNNRRKICSPTIILKMKHDFSNFQNALNQYLSELHYACVEDNCNGIITSTRLIENHLFIETDMIADGHKFSLNYFPSELWDRSDK
jgi:hypothetical protein